LEVIYACYCYTPRNMPSTGKIRVQWTEGRSKGSTSVVKKNDVKVGSIHVGSTVKIVWGKSKKKYEAIILEDLDISPSIPTQRQRRHNCSDEFSIEVGSPPLPHVPSPITELSTPPSVRQDTDPLPDLPSPIAELSTPPLVRQELETHKILQKMEELQDFVSQQSARLLKRMDDMEKLIEEKMSQVTVTSETASSVMTPFRTSGETPLASTVATPPVSISTTLLQDVCVNVQSEFAIGTNTVLTALQGCR
jgi:hypothetical protein